MKVNGVFLLFSVVVVLLITMFVVYRPSLLHNEHGGSQLDLKPEVVIVNRPQIHQPLRLAPTVRKMTDDPSSPLADLRINGYIKLPSLEEMQKMETSALWTTYHSHLDNIEIVCDRKIRMGHIGDGGWEICDDHPVRPVKPCIIYSFGINNDFSFDDDAARLYECKVYSFDPSMKQKTFKRNGRNWFYQLGIGGKDGKEGKWDIKTLSSIRKMLNHTDIVIDVIKMDVELAEWPSLANILQQGDLSAVRQLLVEFHENWHITHETRKEVVEHLTTIKSLGEAGFKKFYVTKNPSCKQKNSFFPVERTKCYEMHYVNTNIFP